MDEEIDRLVVSVRADTAGFQRDVADIRASLDGPLAQGADAAGQSIENALVRAARNGKLGFEDLRKAALSALADIAASALKSGLEGIFGGGGGSSGIVGLLSGLSAAPGRATGGPVSPGRAYMVGEQGPELFVPTAAGSIAPAASAGGGRDVRVSITLNAPQGTEPQALARSSRQVARAVSQALARADR